MAWVERRSNGYLVRWRDGQGKKRQRYFGEERDALLFAESEAPSRPARLVNSSITLANFMLETLHAAEDLRESTRYHYLGMARTHILPAVGSLALADVTPSELRQLFTKMRDAGLSASYRAIARNVLQRTYRLALSDGLVDRDPLASIRAPKVYQHAVTPLDVDEIEALAASIDPRYRAPVLVMAYSGLRIGEVGALTYDNTNMVRRELRVCAGVSRAGGRLIVSTTKTPAGQRTVPMPKFLSDELQKHIGAHGLAPDGRVFHTPGTNQHTNEYSLLHASSIHKPFKEARRRAGLPSVTPHTLRHTYAALLIREGAHPKVIQTLLGHSSIKVTLDLYGHLFPGLGEELAVKLQERRDAHLSLG